MKNIKIKKFLISIVCVMFFLFCLLLIGLYCQKERKNMYALARAGQIKFLQINIVNFAYAYNIKITPIMKDADGKNLVSWRESLFDNYTQMNINDDARELRASQVFGSRDMPPRGQTNFVLICGKGTLWDEHLGIDIDHIPESIDKILLIEIPGYDIRWDSLKDVTVEDACQLWTPKPHKRGLFLKSGLFYVTIRGRYGYISDYQSLREFRENLIFSESETAAFVQKPCSTCGCSRPLAEPENPKFKPKNGSDCDK